MFFPSKGNKCSMRTIIPESPNFFRTLVHLITFQYTEACLLLILIFGRNRLLACHCHNNKLKYHSKNTQSHSQQKKERSSPLAGSLKTISFFFSRVPGFPSCTTTSYYILLSTKSTFAFWSEDGLGGKGKYP